MNHVAFVFPGQGSQEIGMGRALAEAYPRAQQVFDEADAALGESLSGLCFEGPLETLTLTTHTQPAVLATSTACLAALRTRVPGLQPALMAGHSLGEYSALVAAGALAFGDTVRLVRLRGTAMQEAVPAGTGAMSAIMGMEADDVASLCNDIEREMPGRTVSPANYNAPGQIVVAGHADAVTRAGALASERKGRAIPLKVSAPFHCRLMQPAADRLAEALAHVTIAPLSCPVVANVNAEANASDTRVRALLVDQVAGAVRWEQSVRTMIAAGITTFVEVGPQRVLGGLIKRIDKRVTLLNVSDVASLEATAVALGGG